MNTAKIIAVTQPNITDNDKNYPIGVDEFIAYVARVSNPDNQMNHLTAPKLLSYLAKHQHWSPFEMVNIVMEINTTRDIARQILRHRSFSFQEFSQRYADPTQSLGFVTREGRLQDQKNRQSSIEINNQSVQDFQTASILKEEFEARQQAIISMCEENYKWAINNGIAKEQARAVLPEGLTQSRLYMNGTLRSWIHYCQLRGFKTYVDPIDGAIKNGTQKEHREIARDAWYQITGVFPSLKDNLNMDA